MKTERKLPIYDTVVAAREEVAQVDLATRYLPQPWEEILPGDTVIPGEFPDELKRLYAVAIQAQFAAEHAMTNLANIAKTEGKDATDPSYVDRHIERCRMAASASALANIFNAELRLAFPSSIVKPLVFVRRGWKVVWREAPPNEAVVAPQAATLEEMGKPN